MIDGDLTIENSVFQNLAAVGEREQEEHGQVQLPDQGFATAKKLNIIKTPEAGSEGGRFSTPLSKHKLQKAEKQEKTE